MPPPSFPACVPCLQEGVDGFCFINAENLVQGERPAMVVAVTRWHCTCSWERVSCDRLARQLAWWTHLPSPRRPPLCCSLPFRRLRRADEIFFVFSVV